MTTINSTTYSGTKADVVTAIGLLGLPKPFATEISKSLGKTVAAIEADSAPAGADLRGKDLVFISVGGTIDLSAIAADDIKKVDAFIFSTSDAVTFSLNGTSVKAFKGVVTTKTGNDSIDAATNTAGITISSGAGNDIVTTGAGKDYINAGAGNDTINTGAGNDTVLTGAGDDTVNTGAGNDFVTAGSGNDVIDTGAGNDIVRLASGFIGAAVLSGGEGTDQLNLNSVGVHNVAHIDGGGLTITLNGSIIFTATDFEKFTYIDEADGTIVTVGVDDFAAAFHHSH